MKIATTLCALALSIAPTLSLAYGCMGTKAQPVTAMSCADGQVYDAETRACVDQLTG
jgi:hypothetical protein